MAGAALVLLALYFFQSSTLAPNHTDEGLILQYIDAMAHGERPYRDFVDAYGILNWVFPVAFYRAFGDRVWGVRMWLVVLKVVTVVIAYLLVRNLATGPSTGEQAEGASGRGRFYAALAGLWTTVLIGAQWQSLQTPYAFLTVMPLTMGAWYFLLCTPLRKPQWNVYAAALLTAITIWTKLNTGMFLLAGGLFTYFFWIPAAATAPTAEPARPEPSPAARLWLRRARAVGAVAYGVIFCLFMRQHFNVWFFVYLLVPLVLGLGWTIRSTVHRAGGSQAATDLAFFRLYLAVSVALSFAVLVLYYGAEAPRYIRELSGILSSIRYTAPFPPLGEPGHYIGLNEYYWLELPWVLTAAFAVWVALAERFGPRAFGSEWPRRRAQVSALFVLITLHSFVMYARCDETHIYQMLVLVVPAVFIVLAQLDSFVGTSNPRGAWLRAGLAGFCVWFSSSLFVVPTASAFQIGPGDWHNPKLAHLHYRQKFSPYVQDASSELFDHDWDIAEDDAAEYVRRVSKPDEEMLLLTANRLVFLNSDTRPIGGRYHFFFYLASVGLLDRQGFDRLVPKEVLDDIMSRPPRVIVSSMGNCPLAEMFPEFAWLRDHWYEQTRHFRHIIVYELRVEGEPVGAPLR
jgi:hypothetical protein